MPDEGRARDHLDVLIRKRNRLAHELAAASEFQRTSDSYLAKEALMNACTLQIERLRRGEAQLAESTGLLP